MFKCNVIIREVEPLDVEVAEHVASTGPSNGRVKFRDLEGYKEMACVIHKGSYEGYTATYRVIRKYWTKQIAVLEGAWSVKNPEDYITEIQILVTKE